MQVTADNISARAPISHWQSAFFPKEKTEIDRPGERGEQTRKTQRTSFPRRERSAAGSREDGARPPAGGRPADPPGEAPAGWAPLQVPRGAGSGRRAPTLSRARPQAPALRWVPGGGGRSLLSAVDVPLLSGARPSEGVWVCQLLGFRNFPPEGSQSFKGTANEERVAWGRGVSTCVFGGRLAASRLGVTSA